MIRTPRTAFPKNYFLARTQASTRPIEAVKTVAMKETLTVRYKG